jgi:hypothetical protein
VSAAVATYCASCHNGVMRSPANALLDRFDAAAIAANPDAWARAYRQLAAGAMPPVGSPRPDRALSSRLLASIETALGGRAPLPANAATQEIAERLAVMLWNSAPDAPLLSDAGSNRLTEAGTLERHIQRMLADERADEFVSRFFFPSRGRNSAGSRSPPRNGRVCSARAAS